MAPNREGVNPLRPYYIPPTIGEPAEATNIPGPNAFSQSSSGANATLGGGRGGGKYANKARDLFGDLDYKSYVSEQQSSTAMGTVKELLDELLWKYSSVLMAQPFEVAKLVLQVRMQDDMGGLAAGVAPGRPVDAPRRSSAIYAGAQDSDSEGDEPAYFTSNMPNTPILSRAPSYVRPQSRSPTRSTNGPAHLPHHLKLTRPDSVTEVISQVWQQEGIWGLWKGANTTFVYAVLQSLLENWSRSLLSALFDVPDLGLRDLDRVIDLAAPYPWASLGVAATAAVLTGLILAPMDLIRTRLILTPTSRTPRRTLGIIRSLPNFFCPSALILPTALHSLVHPVLSLTTPLILRTKFMIDRDVSPATFSIAKFCSSAVALFVKLPLETVLRRGQVSVLQDPAYLKRLHQPSRGRAQTEDHSQLETMVAPGSYNGVIGTMRIIMHNEGSRAAPASTKAKLAHKKPGKPKVAETVYLKGQGMDGLWRGWKVGWWGLVGLWTAAVVGGGGDGEF